MINARLLEKKVHLLNKETSILLCVIVCILGGCAVNTTPLPLPTVTGEVIPTLHPTIQPISTPLNIPTVTVITSTATPLPSLELLDSFTSSDGEWTALVLQRLLSESNIQQILKVVSNSNATIEWVAEDTVQQDGLTYHWPIPLYWSKNNPFLYFSHQYGGDGCFTAQNFRGSDLWRVNLDTGDVNQLTPKLGYWLAVSPNEMTLAYLAYSQGGLVLRDLASGSEHQTGFDIDAEYPDVLVYKSNLIWSPDSNSLLVTAEIGACGGDLMHSIVKVDVTTLSQTTLLSEDTRLLRTVAWPDVERALLLDNNGGEWWLYIDTGEIISK